VKRLISAICVLATAIGAVSTNSKLNLLASSKLAAAILTFMEAGDCNTAEIASLHTKKVKSNLLLTV